MKSSENQRWLLISILGGISSALALYAYRRYRQETTTVRNNLLAGSQLTNTALGVIEYACFGAGSPILFIHGASGGYDQGMLIARLIGNDYYCIAPSRFSYLGTPPHPDGTSASQADAHAALLDVLSIPKATIVGLSAGGPSSLQFAIRHPHRCNALILVSAVSQSLTIPDLPGGPLTAWISRFEILGWLLYSILRPAFLSLFVAPRELRNQLTPSQLGWLNEFAATMYPIKERFPGILQDIEQLNKLEDYPLGNISAPTLIIHALDDRLVPVEQARHTAKSIPNAQLIELPNGGHLLLGQHEMIIPRVDEFIKQHSIDPIQTYSS